MILHKGNMFDVWGKTDIFLITTNPIVTKLGKCVMGRGIAKQIADKYPEVPFSLGSLITGAKELDRPLPGCAVIGRIDNQTLGYFMVKEHWAEPALPAVIKESVAALQAWINYAIQFKPEARFDLNFPGIGNGKLRREDVLPVIEVLPDNVHVWEYGE